MRATPLPQRFTPAPLALAAAIAIALAAGHAPPAHAQGGAAAAAATPMAIDIPAQPLAQALNELARQANLQMTFPAALVAGKRAPAVRGNLTARQALDRLLSDSGLGARVDGASVVVVAQPPERQLPEVRVRAVQPLLDPVTALTGPAATISTTATRIDVNPRQVPQAISITSTALLSEIGARSVAEAAPLLSGVTRDFDIGRSSLTVRGFEKADQVLVDGLRPAQSGVFSSASD
jgi:outer membrane receptor protein involved in Fe transport